MTEGVLLRPVHGRWLLLGVAGPNGERRRIGAPVALRMRWRRPGGSFVRSGSRLGCARRTVARRCESLLRSRPLRGREALLRHLSRRGREALLRHLTLRGRETLLWNLTWRWRETLLWNLTWRWRKTLLR